MRKGEFNNLDGQDWCWGGDGLKRVFVWLPMRLATRNLKSCEIWASIVCGISKSGKKPNDVPNVSHNSSKLAQPLKYNLTNELNLAKIYGNYFKLKQALKCNLTNEVKLPNVSRNFFKLQHQLKFNSTNEVKLPNVSGNSFKLEQSYKINVTIEVKLSDVPVVVSSSHNRACSM